MNAFRCVAIGYLGHSNGHTGDQLFTLQDQIKHKQDIITALLRVYPTTQLVLAGHSIGAHIVAELMRVIPHDRVAAVYGLYPTMLHIGRHPSFTSPLFILIVTLLA